MNRFGNAATKATAEVMAAHAGDDGPEKLMKLMTATVPAIGILAACALMMAAVVG